MKKLSKKRIAEINEIYLEDMQFLGTSGDTEIAHDQADDLLVQICSALGLDEIVEAYDNVDKWYA